MKPLIIRGYQLCIEKLVMMPSVTALFAKKRLYPIFNKETLLYGPFEESFEESLFPETKPLYQKFISLTEPKAAVFRGSYKVFYSNIIFPKRPVKQKCSLPGRFGRALKVLIRK